MNDCHLLSHLDDTEMILNDVDLWLMMRANVCNGCVHMQSTKRSTKNVQETHETIKLSTEVSQR